MKQQTQKEIVEALENFKPVGAPLTHEQLVQWANFEREYKNLVSKEDQQHVIHMLESIQRWYFENTPLGDFLTAVVHNDLMNACGAADLVNIRMLGLYAKFLYNQVPEDYKRKVQLERMLK